jgi:hypothetical protein
MRKDGGVKSCACDHVTFIWAKEGRERGTDHERRKRRHMRGLQRAASAWALASWSRHGCNSSDVPGTGSKEWPRHGL